MRARLRAAATCCVVALAPLLAACGGSSGAHDVSVFSVHIGECFATPGTVKAELSTITATPCTKPHAKEAYAIVSYAPSSTATVASSLSASAYPGGDVLTSFAQGACAQRFGPYVGVNYLDSALFFTYLLPSARSWEQDADRKVICFVTTTGGTLTSSVKGSKR